MNDKEIRYSIKKGHEIADKIKEVAVLSDVKKLEPEVERYTNYIDEHFGVRSELDGEKENDLSTFLYIALDWKKKSLYPENADNAVTMQMVEDYLSQFIHLLDSESWTQPL